MVSTGFYILFIINKYKRKTNHGPNRSELVPSFLWFLQWCWWRQDIMIMVLANISWFFSSTFTGKAIVNLCIFVQIESCCNILFLSLIPWYFSLNLNLCDLGWWRGPVVSTKLFEPKLIEHTEANFATFASSAILTLKTHFQSGTPIAPTSPQHMQLWHIHKILFMIVQFSRFQETGELQCFLNTTQQLSINHNNST